MRNGYVKISREIFDSEIGNDTDALGLFLYLAGSANWSSFNGLKQGELLVSLQTLSERFDVSRATMWRRIAKLENAGLISREKVGNGTVIRIEKYVEYSGQKKNENQSKLMFDF